MAKKVDPSVVAVIVGTDFRLSSNKLALASLYVSQNGADLIGTFIDRNDGFDRLRPSGGSVVKLVEKAVGATKPAIIMGKPNTMCFDLLREQHNLDHVPNENFLFIGDNLSTDIVFGNDCGIDTLLVLSGVTTAQKAEHTIAKGREVLPPGIAREGIPTYV
jgi:ribonucleotide monophosphatase NagD (HAD superfamily)